jgi:hypothetical protein
MTPAPAPDTASHTCQAQKCGIEVEAVMLMCQPHWLMVPRALREAIEGSHRQHQQEHTEPSGEYLALIKAAIDAVDHRQSRQATPPRRMPQKPVQLALFELTSP